MTKSLPTINQLNTAQQESEWDFGNTILYKLCKDNYKHDQDDQILTKILFIGRIYAAAVERRKKETEFSGDKFYTHIIVPTFKESELDFKLSELETIRIDNEENLIPVLQAHLYLTSLLQKITGLNKRSFSSKYLHFHMPELFFIYDSRAVKGLRQFRNYLPKALKHIIELDSVDKEYANFYLKCFVMKRQIKTQYNIDLSNRQFDKLLLEASNK